MTKVYTAKSNATRAAKRNASKGGTHTEVVAVEGGFAVVAPDALTAPVEAYIHTANELAAMDQFGAGTEAAPKCPHCGIDHMDNGYNVHDIETPNDTNEFACLACGGEWGPALADFATAFAKYKAQGNSMCRSLRMVAQDYQHGMNRQAFIKDAVAHGVKPATASANWACMKRGEF